ncbi:MAG TPA: [Fe-Fe] hydrogenase large subunit C-terminal domain-containing protein [Prolixibacteraceae bacterium]|nr:[Fe-Fe] hydrogenase large subunit C-terminal domain-containing protein [Prolixibacteraceae bacterium]
MSGLPKYHALKVDAAKCIGCTHCMKSCPAEAIRVVNGLAVIDHERCVDCGQCHRACPTKAFYVEQDDLAQIKSFKYRVILFPSIMIGQFPEKYNEDRIYEGFKKVGFTHVYEVEQPMQLLIDSVKEYCIRPDSIKPAISTYCPAIVRLIQSRYPSLTENLIMRKAPHDLAAHFAIERLMLEGARREEIGLFYATPCIAKIASVKSPVGEEESIVDGVINMNHLYNEVMKVIADGEEIDHSEQRENLSNEGVLWSLTRGESRHFGSRSMAIDGIHNVVRFLERLENDQVHGIDFLELRSCDQSCAGGILLTGNRFLTTERLERRAKRYPSAKDISNTVLKVNTEELKQKLIIDSISPKPVFIFGTDRAKAMDKMERAQRIVCFLPGIDCGACGAPNCHALAEDMVNNKAKMSDCIFLQQMWVDEDRIKAKKAFLNVQKKWGTDRFKADCKKRGRRNEGF